MYNVLRFEWDSRKSRSNKAKHGVSFEEARTAFFDENARVIPDSGNADEDRFVLLGLGNQIAWSESFQLEKPILLKGYNTHGIYHEKALRFL